MKIIRIIVTAATAFALVSCNFVQVNGKLGGKMIKGEGELVEKTFAIADIKHFTCNVPAVLTLTNGAPSLEISTYPNILDALSVEPEGDNLVIKSADNSNFRDTKLKINLSCGSLEELFVNGAVDMNTPDGYTAGDLDVIINGAFNWETDRLVGDSVKLTVNGAGNCEISGIDLQNLDVEIDGAGNFELEGKAVNARVILNGAGSIDVKDLKCDSLDTNIHGLGKVKKN